MLKVLCRVRLEVLKSWLTGSSRMKKAQSKWKLAGFALLMLYALWAIGFLFWTIFSGLAEPFHMLQMDWLYFAMVASMSFALMFVGSIFTAKAQLYEAKDNDLLLSMPIKPRDILISRLLMLWIIALVLGLVAAVPALLAWYKVAPLSGLGLASYLIIFVLALPMFSLAVSALFGWLLSVVSARLGGKSLVTVLLSLVFLGAYMYVAFRMNSLIGQLTQNPDGVANALGAVVVLQWIGQACAAGDVAALVKVSLLLLAAFGLAYVILERSFIKTATNKRGGLKKKYVAKEEKASTPGKALLNRELQRFLSSSAYILNCGLGALMALIGAAALAIKGKELVALMGYAGLGTMLQLVLIAGLCFMAAMVLITAPSISLEGKSLWIAQSLPVESSQVLKAKLHLHNLIGLPPILLCSCVGVFVFRPEPVIALCLIALPAVFCVFVGLLGLVENIRHPSFEWINETQAVKSGISVLLTMLISWGVMALPILCVAFLGDKLQPEYVCLGFLLLLVLACLLLHRWLMSSGAQRYREL